VVFHPRRGSIYWVSFDPLLGSRQGKTRPALVLQNDVGNLVGSTTIVAAVTSQRPRKQYPFHVWLPEELLGKPSFVLCEQIRVVALERFDENELAACSDEVMKQVEQALEHSLGLS
jgi:mRNA interferase MazF